MGGDGKLERSFTSFEVAQHMLSATSTDIIYLRSNMVHNMDISRLHSTCHTDV